MSDDQKKSIPNVAKPGYLKGGGSVSPHGKRHVQVLTRVRGGLVPSKRVRRTGSGKKPLGKRRYATR